MRAAVGEDVGGLAIEGHLLAPVSARTAPRRAAAAAAASAEAGAIRIDASRRPSRAAPRPPSSPSSLAISRRLEQRRVEAGLAPRLLLALAGARPGRASPPPSPRAAARDSTSRRAAGAGRRSRARPAASSATRDGRRAGRAPFRDRRTRCPDPRRSSPPDDPLLPRPICAGFEQHHLHAGGGERVRRRAAGQPAADDDDVALQRAAMARERRHARFRELIDPGRAAVFSHSRSVGR